MVGRMHGWRGRGGENNAKCKMTGGRGSKAAGLEEWWAERTEERTSESREEWKKL